MVKDIKIAKFLNFLPTLIIIYDIYLEIEYRDLPIPIQVFDISKSSKFAPRTSQLILLCHWSSLSHTTLLLMAACYIYRAKSTKKQDPIFYCSKCLMSVLGICWLGDLHME